MSSRAHVSCAAGRAAADGTERRNHGRAPHSQTNEGLEQDFLGHLWPPFTQMQGLAPIIMEHAEGAVVYDINGNEYIDAFASLWTVNVGHGRQEIFDAIDAQAKKLAIYHIFQIANEPTIKLAAKVAEHMPGDLNHVFLTLGGGESVETAVKMARQYWRNRARAPSTWSCSATAPTTAPP